MPTRRDLNFGMLVALAAPLVRAAPAGAQVQGVQMLSGDIAGGFADLVEAAVPPGRGGMIAAVVQQGRLVASVARGNASIEMGVGIGLDTSFHIASCSKHVVAMALGLLIDQGVIGLDDPVRRYLPDLPDYGIPITVGQIIHHTSGLREQWTLTSLAGFREGDNILQDDVIDLIYRQRAINTPPGAAYAYSNSGYSLQAALVEKLSGMSLREFSRRFMFEPLGMTSTYWRDDVEEVTPNRALSYVVGGGGKKRYLALDFATYGATGLNTTMADFAKWDRAFYPGSIFSDKLLALATTSGKLNDGTATGYGFGCNIGMRHGYRLISHAGADSGFRSIFMRFPDVGITVLVLCNDWGLNFTGVADGIADWLLANARPSLASLQPVVPAALTAAQRRAWAGRYRAADGTTFDLLPAGTEDLNFQYQGQVLPTLPLSASEALLTLANFRLTFNWQGTTVKSAVFRGVEYTKLVPQATISPASLVGTYWSPDLGLPLTLSRRDDRLYARLGKYPPLALTPFDVDVYWGLDAGLLRARSDGSISFQGHGVSDLAFTRVALPA